MLSVGMPTSLVSQDATPEETALDAERVGEMRVAIAKALESLPPNQRRALVLRFFDGLDVVQVASVMQTTPSNVRNLQSRGARRLASQLPDLRLLSMRTVGGEKVIANAQGERHATR
jgi:RNA polymerase sigma factor (sigma-70 family)